MNKSLTQEICIYFIDHRERLSDCIFYDFLNHLSILNKLSLSVVLSEYNKNHNIFYELSRDIVERKLGDNF